MKKFFFLCFMLFSTFAHAFQCPPYRDFYQDSNQIWHLSKNTPAPAGTYWLPLTQGPLAPRTHQVNTITVMLTYGTLPNRVYCSYGVGENLFMDVSLRVQDKQFPYPATEGKFSHEMPPECKISPEECQFEVKTKE